MLSGFGGVSVRSALAIGLLSLGCRGAEPQTSVAAPEFLPSMCAQDQTRESYCDGLLPMTTAQGAPAPYETCPIGIELPPGAYPAKGSVARFDPNYTEWARQRAKPGHACCYSWCADVQIADVDEVLPYAGCNDPLAMQENYCMTELESGTSAPAPAPLERCPLAIQPPAAVSFSVPRAAPLDVAATQAKRTQGDTSCCYGWCSHAPPGMSR